MNRGQFVTAAAKRCAITPQDGLYATIADRLNDALHEVETVPAAGWDWLKSYVTVPTVAGQAQYTFAAIALAANATDPPEVARILDCRLALTTTNHLELPRRPIAELRDFYSVAALQTPANWGAEAQSLWLYPAPDGVYSIEVRCLLGEPDLDTDDDTPLLPLRYHQVVLQLLCSLLYDELQDTARAQAQHTRYENQLKRMVASARPYGGPGLVRSRVG